MNYIRNRKYPRVYKRTTPREDEEEFTLELSAIAAAGILAFTFISGIAFGCLIKKRLD